MKKVIEENEPQSVGEPVMILEVKNLEIILLPFKKIIFHLNRKQKERFFGAIKKSISILYPASNGLELHQEITQFIKCYNVERTHQGIGKVKPISQYQLVT